MSLDLSSYPSITTALFVRIDVPDFQVLRFSNYYRAFTIGGESYAQLGSLMSIGETTTELKLSDSEFTIVISGIPSTNIDTALDYKLKGSTVDVYRGIFDGRTGELIDIAGNPAGKFKGLVNNFSLSEEYDVQSKTSSVSLVITVTSIVGLLRNKTSGRRTNPVDQKKYYPNDLSMDRVPNLVGSNFNFGAPT